MLGRRQVNDSKVLFHWSLINLVIDRYMDEFLIEETGRPQHKLAGGSLCVVDIQRGLWFCHEDRFSSSFNLADD